MCGFAFFLSVFLRTWVQQQLKLKLEKQEQQRLREASRDYKIPCACRCFFPFLFFPGCWGSVAFVLCGLREIYLCSEKKTRGIHTAPSLLCRWNHRKTKKDQRLVYYFCISRREHAASSQRLYLLSVLFIYFPRLFFLGLLAVVRCFFPLGSVDLKRKKSAVRDSKTTGSSTFMERQQKGGVCCHWYSRV